ncbi:MAG: DUF4864 domain-containing protein [Pseudomonadota bacterium]
MRAAILWVVLALGVSAAVAQERNADIEGVIQSQIDAFLQDDFETAFTYASPAIKRLFGTPDRFGSMVRQGYPMVWRPSSVEYLELEPQGAFQYQRVLVTDGDGVPYLLEYQMIEGDTGWQINGVRFLGSPPLGA